MVTLFTDTIETPIGAVVIIAGTDGLIALDFDGHDQRTMRQLDARFGSVRLQPTDDPGGITSRLRAYFAGDITAIDTIDVDARGTAFQQRVWAALRTIPAGRTMSYAQLAERIGQPTAVRAVGHANSLNPIGIVVPCHRVIGASADLTGYAGGIERKRWLLEHEGVRLAELAAQAAGKRRSAAPSMQAELFPRE